MKKIFLVLLLGISFLKAQVGCMVNSLFGCRPDCKEYREICCTCPCERYAWSYNRGRCAECWHYRTTKDYWDGNQIDYW